MVRAVAPARAAGESPKECVVATDLQEYGERIEALGETVESLRRYL